MLINDEKLKEVHELIEESYKNLDDTALQQKAFQESLKYLGSLHDREHWFCTKKLDALIREALQLFAFSDSSALLWLKTKIKIQLARCHLCIKNYHILKKDIKNLYNEHEKDLDTNIHEYIHYLYEFDYERVYEAISLILERISLNKEKNESITSQAFIIIFECLWEINLLKIPDLKDKFKTLFELQKNIDFFSIYNEVVPGMIYFLFDEKFQDFSSWAEKSLEKLSRKLNLSEFTLIAKNPFITAMDSYLKTNNSTFAIPTSIFWKGASILFHYTEKESIISDLSSQGWDIVGLTCSRLSENTPIILDILNVFSELLNILDSTFWEQAMYCNPINTIDTICQNDYINKTIKTLNKDDEIDKNSFTVFIEPFLWIKPFINSLQNSSRHHSCSRLLFYFLEYFQKDEYPTENKNNCKILAYQILSLIFEILLKNDYMDFDTYLILVQENRKVFENYLKVVINSLFSIQTNNYARIEACHLIGLVLNVDCSILQQEFYNITEKKEYDNVIVTIMNYTYEKIWDALIENIQNSDIDIISQIFQSFSLLSYIEILHSESKRSIHFNKIAMEIILKMTQLLSLFDKSDSSLFETMLQIPEINHSIILLLFSPILEINQLSFNIIKQAYNCNDYYEAFRFNLLHNFTSTLIGLINVIDNFMDIQSFTIASQLVKVSITILDILCSSENGLLLLNKYESKEYQSVIILLWSQFWIFLNMLFSFSLSWANNFPKDSMIIFLKNILEMANNMVNYSKIYDSIILLDKVKDSKEIYNKYNKLSPHIENCLKSSFSWLRLNDNTLLISTIEFICLLFFRLKIANIVIEENILVTLKDFLKKKSHKTNLNNEQKEKLYFIIEDSSFMLNKSYKIKTDDSSIVLQPYSYKNTETFIDNTEKKPKNIYYTKSLKLKESLSNSILQTESKAQSEVITESLHPKIMTSLLESKNNINKYNLKRLNYFKNRSTNYNESNLKSNSIKQFRLELLRDKRRINKALKKITKTNTNTMDSKLFGPEIQELDDSTDNNNLGESISSISECEDNADNVFSVKDDKTYPKIRQIERKSVQRLDCFDIIDKNSFSKQKLQKQKTETLKMKLFPVLSPLYKQILQWDINCNKEIPPNTNEQTYIEIKYKFETSHSYINTFEPLLLLECWQQIIKAKEENVNQSFKIKIINRISVDEFIDLYIFISYEIFYSIVISDSDILVISNVSNPLTEITASSCLAKVQTVSKKKDSVELTLRTYPSNKMSIILRPNNELYGLKLLSLITIQREYSALKSLEYLELRDDIISAKSQQLPVISSNEIYRAMTTYNVNKPQAEAIIGVTKSTGFYLIQGPPGTGKTKTILGMINAFLSESKSKLTCYETTQKNNCSSKLLVCAPSNAAIDEIVQRLKQGFENTQGAKYYPKIVRVGSNIAINLNVKDVSLDNLVEMELAKSNVKLEHDHQIINQENLKKQLNEILEKRDSLCRKLEDQILEHEKKNMNTELKFLNFQKNNLSQQLDKLRDQQNNTTKSLDIARHKIQIDILTKADIICSTLSASGYELFGDLTFDFSTVIIDEAAQCIELSTIIPLKYGCKRCILVGDPNQLPPTVFSQMATNYSYEQSLFVRMQKNCPSSVHMLSIQYRMHPYISQFPSEIFYSNKLIDSENIEEQTKRPWHQIYLFGPYRFFDIHGYEDETSCSPFNLMEAQAALLIYKAIIQKFPFINFNGYFGILTPYKQQLNKIKELFIEKYGDSILKSIDFNTVDGFQGQEKDIIILSCVRSSAKGIGFLSDIRRMNVSLTRAKSSLIILGNAKTLSNHFYWHSLIENAKQRGLLTKFDKILFKTLFQKDTKDDHFYNSNISCNIKEKIINKINSFEKNNTIQGYESKIIKRDLFMDKNNSYSQNSEIFKEKINQKKAVNLNSTISTETQSQISHSVDKKRIASNIFIENPKIRKK
ncbi:hypothetical protein PCK1_002124 [Pneumocystis canis]|nr:hypothetical protein PCK1_002124 [Pneumocystis canis]